MTTSSSSQQGASALKQALRKQTLSRRDALGEAERIEMSLLAADRGIAAPCFDSDEFLPGTIIAGFHPIRSEIDPRPLMAALAARGARLCLPVVLDKTTIEFRELVRGAPLVDCGFGTVGPDESAERLNPTLLLMPLSVFDNHGGRIGYGAGHYDRAIARLIDKGIDPVLIGMGFSAQHTDRVPVEPHDQPLHGMITEFGFEPARP
ncbi:MAG: 5-formyltetrahydrofolate cyclo-ligase [Pseudomonadota bacterium]